MHKFNALLISLCATLSCAAAPSQVVYDNGGPGHVPTVNGFEMTGWIDADDFVLAQETRLDEIKFWNVEISGNFHGSVVWAIYSNSTDNHPGILLHSGIASGVEHVATGLVSSPYVEFANTFAITPVTLPAGRYWLGLHNGPLSNSENQRVYWASTGGTAAHPSHCDIGPAFQGFWATNAIGGIQAELAFQISGLFVPVMTGFRSEGGAPRLEFTTTAGYSYRVEFTESLADPQWQAVPGAESIAGTGQVMQVIDEDIEISSASHRFYRVCLL